MVELRTIKSVSICTFPRSGSIYFSNLIIAKTGYQFPKYHSVNRTKNDIIMVIVRNPLDSISSFATMSAHYDISYNIPDLIKEYSHFYAELLKRPAIIFKYEDLLQNPDKIIKILIKTLNMTDINETTFEEVTDNVSQNHLTTSTKSPHYNLIRKK